jgi:hypothetical protein
MELPALYVDAPPCYRRAMEVVVAAEAVPVAYLTPDYYGNPQDIDAAIAHIEEQMAPAGEARVAEGLHYCAELLSAKPLAPHILKGYAAILGELPAVLLSLALKGGCAQATFHKVPPPGSFMKVVEGEWASLRSTLSRLKRHRDRMQLANRIRPHRVNPTVEAVRRGGNPPERYLTGTTARSPS